MNMPPGYAMDILARLYRRSLSKGVDFDLDMDWMYEVYDTATHCFYSGDALTFNTPPSTPTRRTIDRIHSDKGYTKDNCVICSFKYNQIKEKVFESGDYSPQAIFKMALKLGDLI